MKNSDMNSVLKRLHEGLEFRGIAKRGRIAEVVKTTGYSEGLVSKVLSGHIQISKKFMDAFCRSYALNKEWIETGEGPVTIMEEIRKDYDGLRGRGFEHENSPLFEEHFNTINSTRIESEKYKKNRDMLNFINTFPGEGIGLATGQILSAASKDLACIIALKALLEMSEPDRWRAVAMLKEMNDPDKKEEGP